MKLLYIIVILSLSCSIFAGESEDRVEEEKRLREEARTLVRKAYEKARSYCVNFPDAEITVNVAFREDSIGVTVKCEVVKAYFDGRIG